MASTTLPAASAFTGAAVTEGAFKTAITDLRTMIFEVLGSNATGTQGAKDGFVMLGKAFINESANAQMTFGLTIQQGTADDEILAFRSNPDVTHGITGQAATDCFANFKKYSGPDGGLAIHGLTEANVAMYLKGSVTTETATRSTAAVAPIQLDSYLKSGTGLTTPSANQNVACISAGGTTRFIFDSDGDSHQDVGTAWTNFDDHDDVSLLTALSVHVSRKGDPIRREFRKFLKTNRAALERLGLVTFNRDGHHFVNYSQLTRLLVGAVRQLGAAIADQRGLIDALAARMLLIEQKGAA